MKESIYNLIVHEKPAPVKPPRYISKYHSDICINKSGKQDKKTMGDGNRSTIDPSKFLRKKLRVSKSAEHTEDNAQKKKCYHECMEVNKRPSLPKVTHLDQKISTVKNFLEYNKKNVLGLVPRKAKKVIVDTRKGHKYELSSSGLEIMYINKKDFGTTPKYLIKREKIVSESCNHYEEYVEAMREKHSFYRISDAEKKSILDGLKQNWQQAYKQYQTLSVVVDTLPKMQHKLWLEKQMGDLEKDIELLERYQIIYVAA